MSSFLLFLLLITIAMVVCWLLADRSHWFVLGSAGCYVVGAIYFFLQGQDLWPFGAVALFWAAVGLWQWRKKLVNTPQT
jgi:hypothetical protein